MSSLFLTHVAFSVCCLLPTALGGGGEKHFLGKRFGPDKEEKLWTDFLESESQLSRRSTKDAEVGFLAGSPPSPSASKHTGAHLATSVQRSSKLQYTAESHDRRVGEPRLVDMPAQTVAAKPHEARKKPIITPFFNGGWASWGGHTKSETPKTQKAKSSLISTNSTNPCASELKQCREDEKNCGHVLDILQFLRLQHIAVEKRIQSEAKSGMLLQSLLEKNGLVVPKPADWHWTGESGKLFLQSALEQKNTVALPNQNWQWTPSTPPLSHPLPDLHNQEDAPLHHSKSAAQPLKFHLLATQCPPGTKKKLSECSTRLENCKAEMHDLNSVLNRIAPRARQERNAKLKKIGLVPHREINKVELNPFAHRLAKRHEEIHSKR